MNINRERDLDANAKADAKSDAKIRKTQKKKFILFEINNYKPLTDFDFILAVAFIR